jgi:hypothetical protein
LATRICKSEVRMLRRYFEVGTEMAWFDDRSRVANLIMLGFAIRIYPDGRDNLSLRVVHDVQFHGSLPF